jgi:hypothetical protein
MRLALAGGRARRPEGGVQRQAWISTTGASLSWSRLRHGDADGTGQPGIQVCGVINRKRENEPRQALRAAGKRGDPRANHVQLGHTGMNQFAMSTDPGRPGRVKQKPVYSAGERHPNRRKDVSAPFIRDELVIRRHRGRRQAGTDRGDVGRTVPAGDATKPEQIAGGWGRSRGIRKARTSGGADHPGRVLAQKRPQQLRGIPATGGLR